MSRRSRPGTPGTPRRIGSAPCGLDGRPAGRNGASGREVDGSPSGQSTVADCQVLERAFSGTAEEALARAGPLDPYVRQVGGQSGICMAEGYAMAGETARALEMLEVAVDQGFINYPFLAKYDNFLEPVRRDPRGQVLLARVRREWETFDA